MKRALGVAALLLTVSAAHADARTDTRKACVEAVDHGQVLRDKGKLSEARQAFLACARDECPAMVSRQCTTWLGEVDHEIPTVSIRARDGQGRDLVDVSVFVDEALKVSSLDGRSMPLDPGVHKFRFVHGGDPSVEQDVIARSGEKDRIIDVRFAGKVAAEPPPVLVSTQSQAPPAGDAHKGGFHFPVFAGVMFGLGAASFAGMAVSLVTAASDANQMRATCAGSCKQSDVDWARTRIILGNVAMGVGIACVSLGVLSLIISNVGRSSSSTAWELRVGPGQLGLARTF